MRTSFLSVLALSVLALSSCVSRQAYLAQTNKIKGLSASLDQLTQYLEKFESENAQLAAQNASFRRAAKDVELVREQKERLAKLLKELESAGGGIDIPGVRAIETSEGVGLRIDDAVLFASGQATLSPQGKDTVRKLVALLQRDGRAIRIDGHTDSDPIRKSSWASNLHLSVARALAVAAELEGQGFAMAKLQVRGLGDTRPESRIPTEKAKNRRVELFFIQD
ncbi:MAG: OmpA family protein [Planctomycetes bacterium]|nr:OmpA family protein [Planctomycetota bacterium]